MSIDDQASVSALLDGEADDLELRRFLKAAENDAALLETWERMSLVQALLHDDNLKTSPYIRKPGTGVAAAVSVALAAEPASAIDSGGWWRGMARIAIAASVAVVVFVGLQASLSNDDQAVVAPVALNQAAEPGGAASVVVADVSVGESTERREVDPAARQRLEEYIRSVSITREEPAQLEQLQDSPLYKLVNEIIKPQ